MAMLVSVLCALLVSRSAAFCCYYSASDDLSDWCSDCGAPSSPGDYCDESEANCLGPCEPVDSPNVWCGGDGTPPPTPGTGTPPPTPGTGTPPPTPESATPPPTPVAVEGGFCCFYSNNPDTSAWCGSCGAPSGPTDYCSISEANCLGPCAPGEDPVVWCDGGVTTPPPTPGTGTPPPTPEGATPPPTPAADEGGFCCFYSNNPDTSAWCGSCGAPSGPTDYCSISEANCLGPCAPSDGPVVWCPGP